MHSQHEPGQPAQHPAGRMSLRRMHSISSGHSFSSDLPGTAPASTAATSCSSSATPAPASHVHPLYHHHTTSYFLQMDSNPDLPPPDVTSGARCGTESFGYMPFLFSLPPAVPQGCCLRGRSPPSIPPLFPLGSLHRALPVAVSPPPLLSPSLGVPGSAPLSVPIPMSSAGGKPGAVGLAVGRSEHGWGLRAGGRNPTEQTATLQAAFVCLGPWQEKEMGWVRGVSSHWSCWAL